MLHIDVEYKISYQIFKIYWMRLGTIPRIIQTEVSVICRSEEEDIFIEINKDIKLILFPIFPIQKQTLKSF